jgi:hypothetical protein
MKFIANRSFTAGSGVLKGRKFEANVTVISEKLYARVESTLKKNFDAIEPKAAERVLYSMEEKLFAIEAYLENVEIPSGVIDQDRLFAEFHSVFPERSYNSYIKLLYAIRARDSFVVQRGLTTVAKDVAEALHSFDPERFPLEIPNKVDLLLDSLLADIRG